MQKVIIFVLVIIGLFMMQCHAKNSCPSQQLQHEDIQQPELLQQLLREQLRLAADDADCPNDFKRIVTFFTPEGRSVYRQAHEQDEGICKIQEVTIRNENVLIMHHTTRLSYVRELRRLRSLIRSQDNQSGIVKGFEPNQEYRPVQPVQEQ